MLLPAPSAEKAAPQDAKRSTLAPEPRHGGYHRVRALWISEKNIYDIYICDTPLENSNESHQRIVAKNLPGSLQGY